MCGKEGKRRNPNGREAIKGNSTRIGEDPLWALSRSKDRKETPGRADSSSSFLLSENGAVETVN